MRTKSANLHTRRSLQGATLIEILVAVLILSFGLLAIGNMMAYAIQLPKVAGNRAVASTLAIELTERLRANAGAFTNEKYGVMTYTGTAEIPDVDNTKRCAYPTCTPDALAIQDLHDIHREIRMQLPSGGLFIEKPGSGGDGRVFILWKEAASAGSLGKSGELYAGDICPALVNTLAATAPRCLMVRFKP